VCILTTGTWLILQRFRVQQHPGTSGGQHNKRYDSMYHQRNCFQLNVEGKGAVCDPL
jgi:hypothetical protein